jgi:hypothetical protein
VKRRSKDQQYADHQERHPDPGYDNRHQFSFFRGTQDRDRI